MATILEKYWELKQEYSAAMKDIGLTPAQIWQYQELLYRTEVIEACQMLQRSAPESMDNKTLRAHYVLVDAYMEILTRERRHSPTSEEAQQKRRDTAHHSLCLVIQDYRKRFSSFVAKDAATYQTEIGKIISVVLPVWLGYRETYIKLLEKEAA